MPLATAELTYNLATLTGVARHQGTSVTATTNIPGDTVVDTDGNQIRLGSGKGSINPDGTGKVDVWIPGTGSNPASWQTYVSVRYREPTSSKGWTERRFGPFTITASADLADLIEEQEVPPTYLSTVTDLLDTYVTEAEAARDAAVAIAGPVDGTVEALVKNTGGVGPLTSAALLNAFTKSNNTGTNASTPRAPFTTTFDLSATTPGTDDFAVHVFRANAKDNFTGVTATNPGWFFGTNMYTTVGGAAGDGVGLTQVLNLAEVSILGDDFTGNAVGFQAEAAFLGASAGGTAASMISMKVAAPKRKDGATAGNATAVYGLYVDSVPAGTLGSSTAYSLFVAGGASYFSGDTTVAGDFGVSAAKKFFMGARQIADDGTNVTMDSPLVVTGFVTGTDGFYTTGDIYGANLLYAADSSRKITWGNGAPAAAHGSGSIYLRLDGGAGSTFYVREGAAWVTK